MDIQKEFDKIKASLESAEGCGNISKETPKNVQERFWLLFTLINQQQETIEKQQKDIDSWKVLSESCECNKRSNE
ncbi:hypothetical protein ABD91_21075 [Lysinibacillus sphaericus]|uniref:hypothetical protein n=1 Tax=Lysinibacillus sphaericus TaxID=1421 RepID=UPI0018CDB70A|nr:hypothetical protein [Lysinibacillus sphaericus]MBG9693234.1 hypothetical protein [Lysinibacillus sphaericus]